MNRYSVVDLHCHTNHSDGVLSPLQLLERAEEKGVELLAITDHDVVSGVREAMSSSKHEAVRIISGIELSSVWSGISVHVVGLNFDMHSPFLDTVLQRQREARNARSQAISDRLEKVGVKDSLQGALKIACHQRGIPFSSDADIQLGRPHFAQYLVDQGVVEDRASAFRKYLGAGKTGDVKSYWPELSTVVGWIKELGGQAVLAHPQHYKMTNTKMRKLVTAFASAGGDAIEIAGGGQSPQRMSWYVGLCMEFGLKGSSGSDFHGPFGPWIELGKVPTLPGNCEPIWESW